MNFLKKLFRNKLVLSLSCLLILGLIFLPSVASAAFENILGDFLGAASKDLGQAILGAIFGMLMTVPLYILNVALDVLNWVASGDFLVVSFTGVDNVVVTTGWTFVRNLANVVLIFGLVLIALSIILGYQETKAKKMLVDFVLIAVLINFTPVICGLVIDAAKIIMDLLLSGGVPPDFATLMATKMNDSSGADFATFVVLAGFCLFSAVVYFLFALLFLVRIAMLWILIILSPIAFATKVLPQSKYIMRIFPSICQWDEWWNNFLQWTFIGIPAAGAIWLSNLVMFEIAMHPNSIMSVPGGNFLSGALGMLLSYALPFIILVVGFFATLDQGGAAGSTLKGIAGKVIGAGKSAAIGGVVGGGLGFASGVKAGASQGGVGGAVVGGLKGGGRGILTGGEQEKKQINRWYQRKVKERLGTMTAGTTAGDEGKDIDKISKTYENLDDKELEKEMQQHAVTEKNIQEKIAAIITAIKRGNEIREDEIAWIEKNKDGLEKRGVDLHKVANYAPELASRVTTNATTEDIVKGKSNKQFHEDTRDESFKSPEFLSYASNAQLDKTLKDGNINQVKGINDFYNGTTDHAYYEKLKEEKLREDRSELRSLEETEKLDRQIEQLAKNMLFMIKKNQPNKGDDL
ncbi:MAG: hypothetical protein WC303_02900 [Candidatus Paceibacterota bacterium]|jgi:hypothetical protein